MLRSSSSSLTETVVGSPLKGMQNRQQQQERQFQELDDIEHAHYDFTYLIHPFDACITTKQIMPILTFCTGYDQIWDSRTIRFRIDFSSEMRITADPNVVHTAWGHVDDWIDRESRFNAYCNVLMQNHFKESYESRSPTFSKDYRALYSAKLKKEERNKKTKTKDKSSRKRRDSKDINDQRPIDAQLLAFERQMTADEIMIHRKVSRRLFLRQFLSPIANKIIIINRKFMVTLGRSREETANSTLSLSSAARDFTWTMETRQYLYLPLLLRRLHPLGVTTSLPPRPRPILRQMTKRVTSMTTTRKTYICLRFLFGHPLHPNFLPNR